MRWIEPSPIDVSADLRAFVGGHPVIAERLWRAGLQTIEDARAFLNPIVYRPASPFELPDMEIAVARLHQAMAGNERMLVWGDFDVDGQTATAILIEGLTKAGANVRAHVPVRHGEGHGISLRKMQEWLKRGIDVVITCDTGVTAHDGVAMAQAAGVDVIITDHHLPGDFLPSAYAIVNPQRLPEGHALRDLSGAGIAWQLIAALIGVEQAADGLDLVALGIVADVASQTKDTRYLLQLGLEKLISTRRIGMRALYERANIDFLHLTEREVGFELAPRFNAQGRLGDASACVELLTTTDEARAAELANQLEGMNAQRKLETRLIEAGVASMIERDPSVLDYAAIVLSHEEWGSGVLGVVANRLVEQYRKPVVLLNAKDGKASGPARSIPGVSITDALKVNREMLDRFGGHAMAAGVSLKQESVFDFRRQLSRTVREMAKGISDEATLQIDAFLGLDEISLEFINDIRRLAPFGNGNPDLHFVSRDLHVVRRKKLGRGSGVEMVVADDSGKQQKVQWWKAREEDLPAGRFDLAYRLFVSRFKEVEPVLDFADLRPTEQAQIEIEQKSSAIEIEDLSDATDAQERLTHLLEVADDPIVWREFDASIDGMTRQQLRRANTLIIWTTPPGHEELQRALDVVRPRRIVLFGKKPASLDVAAFLKRLGGLAKHVLGSGGETTLLALAAATAQREQTVKHGIRWWGETNRLRVEFTADGQVRILPAIKGAALTERKDIEKLIENALEETEAYRATRQTMEAL